MQSEEWPRNVAMKKSKQRSTTAAATSKIWSTEEDSLLCQKYYDEGVKIESIVPLLKRSYTAVKARIDFVGEKYLSDKVKQTKGLLKEKICDDHHDTSKVTMTEEQFNIICESFSYIINNLNDLHKKVDHLSALDFNI
jgi:hypothetical protein